MVGCYGRTRNMTFEPQSLSWWCGVASIQSAMGCLGVEVTQELVASRVHCTKKHGTPEDEIQRGLLACGAGNVDVWNHRRRQQSLLWLQHTLLNTGPAILAVDHDQHWITVIGYQARTTFIVFDSIPSHGLIVYSWENLAARWRLGNHRGGPNYYGIGASL